MDDPKLQEFLKHRSTANYSFEPYAKTVQKPWGYEIHWVRDNAPYMGKLIHIEAGKRVSLQIHDQKTESWFLLQGRVNVAIENSSGEMEMINLEQGSGYTTVTGQKHRLIAVDDSDIMEVSTPEIGNTYRLEDDYARPTETEQMRSEPNRGWKG